MKFLSFGSTRGKLIAVIAIVFTLLTTLVATSTAIVVDKQLVTVTVGTIPTATEADEQEQQDGAPKEQTDNASDSYVSVNLNQGSTPVAVVSTPGNEKARNLVLFASIAPIAIFGMLSAIVTWFVATRAQQRVDLVVLQLHEKNGALSRTPVNIPYRNDAASRIAEAYNDAINGLNQSIRRERLFIADASHELKNPLAAASAALEIPLHKGLFNEQTRPFVRKALESNQSCAVLVNRLLELARVQRLEQICPEKVDIAHITQAVLHRLTGTISEDMVMDVRLESAVLQGDELLMTQVVQNLIQNAVQHNDTRKKVWISTGQVCDDAGTWASLVVENTGEDLTDDNPDELLTPFNRGHNSRISTMNSAGIEHTNHGLGLSIVQEIVCLHNGAIRLEARTAGGLRVEARMPSVSSIIETKD